MTIFVIGGSNSILRGGWTRRLPELAEGEPVANLSIGATASITGLYRLMFTADPAPGDTIIWEYALNDIIHVDSFHLGADYLLRYVEILLDHCIAREIRFVALLFVPQVAERAGAEPEYKARLRHLFDRRGVAYADIPAEFRTLTGTPCLEAEHFETPNHYHTGSPIIDFIEDRVSALLRGAGVPQRAERLHAAPSAGIGFLDTFTGGTAEVRGTSIYRARTWRPEPLLSVTTDTGGTIIAAMVYASTTGGALRIATDSQKLRVSATLPGDEVTPARLSPSFINWAWPGAGRFERGAQIAIGRAVAPGPVLSGTHNKPNLTAAEAAGEQSALVGLLVEIPGGAGSIAPKSTGSGSA